MTIKDLEQICYAQSNKVKYLGLDVNMRHVKHGNQELVYWNVHDKGNVNSTLAEFLNRPDVATFQLIQWITLCCLPEDLF